MHDSKITKFAYESCQNLINSINPGTGLYHLFCKEGNRFVEKCFKQDVCHAWNERNLSRWWQENRQLIFSNLDWMDQNDLFSAEFKTLPTKIKLPWSLRNKSGLKKWKCFLAIFSHSFLERWYLVFILPRRNSPGLAQIQDAVRDYSKTMPDLSDSDQFVMPTVIDSDKYEMSVGNIVRLTHDIRKPLANLSMNHQNLSQSLNLSDEDLVNKPEIMKAALKRFGLQLKQMESFTHDLLHLSTGQIPDREQLQEFSIQALITDILAGFEDSFRMHKISVEKRFVDDFIILQNKILIDRIIYNLFSNAWQHCSNPGTIYLDLAIRGKWMKLDIEDSGKSMQLKDDTFELSGKNIGRGGGGWGIGLASSVKMAQEIGGSLKHRPSIYGKGAHFLLVLPDKK